MMLGGRDLWLKGEIIFANFTALKGHVLLPPTHTPLMIGEPFKKQKPLCWRVLSSLPTSLKTANHMIQLCLPNPFLSSPDTTDSSFAEGPFPFFPETEIP